MAKSGRIKRDKRINVRVTDDNYLKLQYLAEEIGIAPTTLAGVAVSKYISKNYKDDYPVNLHDKDQLDIDDI